MTILPVYQKTSIRQPYLRDAPDGLPFELDQETVQKGLNFTLTTKLGNLDLLGEVIGSYHFSTFHIYFHLSGSPDESRKSSFFTKESHISLLRVLRVEFESYGI